MDEKTIQRIKKLQALAERGVGGEKTTAQKKLAKLLKDNGINSLDELQKEEYEYTIFSYNGKHEIKLLRQCMYKVMGAKSDRTAYKPYGRRQKIGIYCTKAQKIEIELEFEFYRNVFYEELSTFMDAFIQAQKIFPEDAPVGDYDEFNERDMKIAFMATGIERRSRAVVCDEMAAWSGDAGLKQYEVMKSALGARTQPMILSISTAGYINDSIYDELMKRSTSFLKGNSKERRLLPFLYMIDDVEKWNDIDELKNKRRI